MTRLIDMTQDELYELATECDDESGKSDHIRNCEPCKAWLLWNKRNNQFDRQAAAAAAPPDPAKALKRLLWELPNEFSEAPGKTGTRPSFQVVKESNVRKVHEALWELQRHFGINQEDK